MITNRNNMETRFYGIYIGAKNDRRGTYDLNYGMTGFFIHNEPNFFHKNPFWTFLPDGSTVQIVVSVEDIYSKN